MSDSQLAKSSVLRFHTPRLEPAPPRHIICHSQPGKRGSSASVSIDLTKSGLYHLAPFSCKSRVARQLAPRSVLQGLRTIMFLKEKQLSCFDTHILQLEHLFEIWSISPPMWPKAHWYSHIHTCKYIYNNCVYTYISYS